MTDYYKNGYLEAVLFLFAKGNMILVECRPKGNSKEIFIPNGRIDSKDLKLDENDYKIVAMNREVSEEFSDKVKIKEYTPLGEFIVDILKIKFFGYLITGWNGEIPEYTVEEGKKFADLKWIHIREYKKFLKLPSAHFFVGEAIKILNKGGKNIPFNEDKNEN